MEPITNLQADTLISQLKQDQLGGINQTDDFRNAILTQIKVFIADGIPQDRWQDTFDSMKTGFGIVPDKNPIITAVPQIDNNSPLLGKTIRYKSVATDNTISRPYAAIVTTVYANHIVDLAVFGGSGVSYKYQVAQGTNEGQWSTP